jgi:hypothetical protein
MQNKTSANSQLNNHQMKAGGCLVDWNKTAGINIPK